MPDDLVTPTELKLDQPISIVLSGYTRLRTI